MVAIKFIISALLISQASAAVLRQRTPAVEISASRQSKNGLQFVGEPVLAKPHVKVADIEAPESDLDVDLEKRDDLLPIVPLGKLIVGEPVLNVRVKAVKGLSPLARDLLVSDPVLAFRVKSKSLTTIATSTIKSSSTSASSIKTSSTTKATTTTMVTSTAKVTSTAMMTSTAKVTSTAMMTSTAKVTSITKATSTAKATSTSKA